jgi:hypothetical protein
MRESIFEYVSSLNLFSDVEFNVTAKNGKLVVLLVRSDGTLFPYISADYTADTAISVIASLKAALTNDHPPARSSGGMQAENKVPLRKDPRAVKKLIVDGFIAKKSMAQIQGELLSAGISKSMFKDVITEIRNAGESVPSQ